MSKRDVTRKTDTIETYVSQWKEERPELDPWPLAVLGRTQRISALLQSRAEKQWLAKLGLTWESFSLLLTLRRSGPPFELRPTDIYKQSLLSSGATTNRIDRVEKQGWVKRLKDPHDRRGVIVRLTPAGKQLADKAVKIHFQEISAQLSALGTKEREQIVAGLSRLLAVLETRDA